MQDVLRDFIKRPSYQWSELPEKATSSGVGLCVCVCTCAPDLSESSIMSWFQCSQSEVAVQMNDTHPTIAVAEMMSLLVPWRCA